MDAETPSLIQTFDVPQLEFDHLKGTWTATDCDVFQMVEDTRYLNGLGQSASVTVCPLCAYFSDGQCNWCPGEYDADYPSPRPECAGCLGADRPTVPWYKRSDVMGPLLTTIGVTVAASIASAVLLRKFGYR